MTLLWTCAWERKKDQSLCLGIDYRLLNKKFVQDKHPIPPGLASYVLTSTVITNSLGPVEIANNVVLCFISHSTMAAQQTCREQVNLYGTEMCEISCTNPEISWHSCISAWSPWQRLSLSHGRTFDALMEVGRWENPAVQQHLPQRRDFANLHNFLHLKLIMKY